MISTHRGGFLTNKMARILTGHITLTLCCPRSKRIFDGFHALSGLGRRIKEYSALFQAASLSTSGKEDGRVKDFLHVSEEVQDALHWGKSVVALESTIITHGMPSPHNYSTALSVEKIVRDAGSTPATIAVLEGKIHVGLSTGELQYLADDKSSLVKISRRDLAFVLSQGLSGGTTVSATMIAAHMAGIPVFATGGIGGVHREAETSFDVSADLTELGRTPVAVVSSGVKSILDIGKTLEYLETQGVFVASFGESKNFPAFFSRDSGFKAPYNTATAECAARAIETQLRLGLSSGALIAVPIPEQFAASGDAIEEAIHVAVQRAQAEHISGKQVTPFILDQVNKLTGGESLQANIALVQNNAKVAGEIANCLAQMRSRLPVQEMDRHLVMSSNSGSSQMPSRSNDSKDRNNFGRPVVIGTTITDFTVQVEAKDFQMNGGTYPGKLRQSFGGVGRNLADCLTRLGNNPVFVSAVGKDELAANFFNSCQYMDLEHVQRLDSTTTATYCPVLDASGVLLFGVGDVDINSKFTASSVPNLRDILRQAPLLVLDGNFTISTISDIVNMCYEERVPVWFEPSNIFFASKPFESEAWQQLTFTSPNLEELKFMWNAMMQKTGQTREEPVQQLCKNIKESDHLPGIIQAVVLMCSDLVTHIPVVLVTLAHHGVVLCHGYGDVTHLTLGNLKKKPESTAFHAIYYPVMGDLDRTQIASVSGCGDCLASGIITGILQGQSIDTCLKMGLKAANVSIQSFEAVPKSINPQVSSAETTQAWYSLHPVDVTSGVFENNL